jgi:hypothetical protein
MLRRDFGTLTYMYNIHIYIYPSYLGPNVVYVSRDCEIIIVTQSVTLYSVQILKQCHVYVYLLYCIVHVYNYGSMTVGP